VPAIREAQARQREAESKGEQAGGPKQNHPASLRSAPLLT